MFSGEDLLDFNFKMDKNTRKALCEKLFIAANPEKAESVHRTQELEVLNASFEDAMAKKLDLKAGN